MVKKNVLTPVLAGVLGLSIVGSGVGYYMVNKDGGNGADKGKSKSSTTTSPKITVMAENISNTLSRAQDIATGEVDFAYEGSLNVSFGTAITKEAGTDIKDIGMNVSTKQKGGNEGGDITLTYGGSTLMTINEVLSRENSEEMFVKIPELSDAYLKVGKEDVEKYVKEEMGMDMSELTQAAEDIDIDFDAEAFEADINEYEKIVKDNFPEVKEEGTKSGDIDGISYEYTSKSYEVTNADAQKIATAVLEKAKTDENLKSLYEQGVDKVMNSASAMGSEDTETPPTYEESIDKMLEEVKTEISEEDSEKVFLETYENADGEFMGFNLKPDGEEGEFKYVIVSNDNAEGIDLSFDSGESEAMTVYGALKSENDAVNGSYTITANEDGVEILKLVYDIKDVKTVGDNFSGTIRIDASIDDNGEANSGWFEITSNSTEDNVDISFDIGINGENAMTISMTSKKTEASDVELPAADAKIFDALDEEQMNKYLEECDMEGFQSKMKETLGDDMYNNLFGGSASSAGSQYSYDDDEDYDFDDEDFDWEQFESEMNETETDEPA